MMGRPFVLCLLIGCLLSGVLMAQPKGTLDSLLDAANAAGGQPQEVISVLSRHLLSMARPDERARIHDRIASSYREINVLDSAAVHAWHVLALADENDIVLRSRANALLGFVAFSKNAFTRSAGFYAEASRGFARLDDKQGLLEAFLYQARINERLRFPEESLKQYEQARVLTRELRDSETEQVLILEMAGVLRTLERYREAEDYLRRSLTLSVGDTLRTGAVQLALGELYEDQLEYGMALDHYHLALVSLREKDPFPGYHRIAATYARMNHVDSARRYADSAEAAAIASGEVAYLRDCYQARYRLATQMQDTVSAYSYLLFFKQYDDSVRQHRAQADIRNAREEVFLSASEAAVRNAALQSQLNIVRDREASNQRTYIMVSTGLGLLAALFLALWYFTRRRTREKLAAQQELVRDLSGKNERVFAHMAHELHGPVSVFSNLARSMHTQLKEARPEEVAQMLKHLHVSTKEVEQSLHELMDWAVTQSGTMPVRPEVFSGRKLAEQVQEELRIWAEEHGVTTELLVPEGITAFADRSIVKIVLRTLLHHAIAASPEGQTVTVFSGMKDAVITMGVKHHGPEMTASQIAAALSWDSSGENRGVGLPMCRELIGRAGGELFIESLPGQGTTTYFTLPERLPNP